MENANKSYKISSQRIEKTQEILWQSLFLPREDRKPTQKPSTTKSSGVIRQSIAKLKTTLSHLLSLQTLKTPRISQELHVRLATHRSDT